MHFHFRPMHIADHPSAARFAMVAAVIAVAIVGINTLPRGSTNTTAAPSTTALPGLINPAVPDSLQVGSAEEQMQRRRLEDEQYEKTFFDNHIQAF